MSDTNLAEDAIAPPPIRGDLTRGPVLRTLIRFSVPTLGTSLLQSLGMTINSIWIGQLLGESALAATSNASNIAFLAFATVFGFSTATTIRVGQKFGAGDIDGVRRAFGGGTGFSTGVTIVGAVLGWIFMDALLDILATPVVIRAQAREYLDIVFLAMPFTTLMMMISTGLRGCGDARTPLYATILSTTVSVILNPVLILGLGPLPAMGLAGSALTVVIGNVVASAVMLSLIYGQNLPVRLKAGEFRYLLGSSAELGYVLSKGVPMGAQTIIATLTSLVMMGIVNREGPLTAAAYGAVLPLWNYIQMPALSLATAVSAIAAQNIGAGKISRVGHVTMAGAASTAIVTLSTFAVLVLFDEPILSLFLGRGSAAIPIAEEIALYGTWAWVFGGLSMVLNGTLRAFGVVMQPLLVMMAAYYPARVGFYYLLYPVLGADAIWLSFTFGGFVSLMLSLLVYAKGGWRQRSGIKVAVATAG